MANPSAFNELIERSKRENWCTSPGCTTCGALPFRRELREIAHDDVIAGLREMSGDALSSRLDMFRLVVNELSIFGFGGELLDPLKETPAGAQLRADIDHREHLYEKRQVYLATQTPEAIERRRAERKAKREELTSGHRARKETSHSAIQKALQLLEFIPDNEILIAIDRADFDAPLPAIGGLVYKRLRSHYRTAPMQPKDQEILSNLANEHRGYWKKLYFELYDKPY